METNLSDYISNNKNILSSGKMLRSRLILYLGHNSSSPQILTRAGAAVDIIHAASLVHDDVIDGGIIRRGAPTFLEKTWNKWSNFIWHLMMFRALSLLVDSEETRSA